MALKQFNITELDFDKIKQAIKDYYKRSESPFKDLDYEGSGLNVILDILAHNTHYNAVLAHLAANETFISSAQLRKNVVARAKSLGYTPHSTTASTAKITLTNLDSSITSIPEGTIFSSTDTLNNVTYNFVTIEEIGTPSAEFQVFQGSFKTREYSFDTKAENLKFEIPDSNVDITKLTVTVRESATSTQKEIYTQFSELPGIDGTSAIYFINENPNGNYEIQFGDGILGKKPAAASIIEIKYLATDGDAANGLSTFTTAASIFDSVGFPTVTTSGSSFGGSKKETIESIRENAPLQFLSQNRAVTVDDYKSLIRKNTSAAAISVWGGEDNDPPEYGRVFISVKPENGDVLTQNDKDKLEPILNDKGVITVRPKFVDPDYTYLYFDIFSQYNSSLTNLSAPGISSKIRTGITAFNTAYLADFEGVFRYSEFLTYLTNLDVAILSVFARVYAYKKFTATTTNTTTYKVNFNFELDEPEDPTETLLTSTGYTFNGVEYFFKDEASTVANIRNIYRYHKNADDIEIIDERNVGTVNFLTGVIEIKDFNITADTEIKLFVRPKSNDIAPKRNQIIEIDSGAETAITSNIDTIATRGSAGAASYTTIARDR